MMIVKKRELIAFLVITVLIIILFLIIGDIEIAQNILENNKDRLVVVAIACLVLLTLDILLPLPSSIIMILTGSLLGFIPGLIINYVGIVISNMVGYYLGRLWPAYSEKINEEKFGKDLRQFGLIATRGVPVLAESVAITAGYTRYPIKKYLISILLGNLPYCIIYSLSGSFTFRNLEILIALAINLILISVIYIIQKSSMPEKS